MGRIIIFTGKGGVGKTSISAGHAFASAREGKRTLLVSTDMAHSLGDVFERKVGGAAVPVAENLEALELDPAVMMREEFPDITSALENMLDTAGVKVDDQEGFLAVPGMDDLFALMKIGELYEKGEYERIIVDCAPTGETLTLLKLPELLAWYLEKFFPVGKVAMRVLAPVSKHVFDVQLPNRQAMSDVERVYTKLVELQELLKNKDVTTIRLVCIPEKMVVEETKRSYMYMNLYRYQVDGVYINRVLPEGTGNEFLDRWRGIQQGYVQELERVFPGIPITKIPWYPEEVQGTAAVERLCGDMEGTQSLFDVRVRTENEVYSQWEEGYDLTLQLPGVQEQQLDVAFHGMDVTVKIGNFNRCIPLPNTLREYEMLSAGLEGEMLKIRFRKPERKGARR